MNVRNHRKTKHKYNFTTQRQANYQSHWAPHDKPKAYDAMEDKHASYYFVGRSVKKHMKNLKKAVTYDQRNQTQRERLKTLINDKIKFKFPEITAGRNPQRSQHKIQIYSNQSKDLLNLNFLTRKSTRFSPRRKSTRFSINQTGFRQKRSVQFDNEKIGNQEFQTLDNDNKQKSLNKSVSKAKSPRNNVQQILESQLINKKQHNKFMKFLQTKRQLVKKRMDSSKSQTQFQQQKRQRYEYKELQVANQQLKNIEDSQQQIANQ